MDLPVGWLLAGPFYLIEDIRFLGPYPVPEVVLVAVKHPMYNLNPYSVESLETTLQEAIGDDPGHPINIDDVLAMITEKGGQENVYDGTVHCEVALAALILLACNLSTADAVRLGSLVELLLNVDETTIVVSKLCCPGCWESLDILRDNKNLFNICGHHPTLFPFELPACLSPQVLHEMITRFRGILCDEILTMMSTTRVCASSRQCISNSSTGSQKDKPSVSAADFDANLSKIYGSYVELCDDLSDNDELDDDEELDDSSEDLAKDLANQATSTSTPFVLADTSS